MEAGYLGVGNMGQPMAHKLLDAGHGLTVYDINEAAMRPLLERQARRAASPKDLADRCEIVFVSLPTLAAFREVAFGTDGLAKGKAMKLLVNTCTVGVPFVKEIEQASLWGRTLTVASDKPGAAQVLKLTNNILSAVALAATAEAFVMGAKGGLDPEVMLGAINAGSGRNSATESKFPTGFVVKGGEGTANA